MSDGTENQTCNQKGCDLPSEYLYTWPGKDQCGSCGDHAMWAKQVATAMGFHLQLIPVVSTDTGEQP